MQTDTALTSLPEPVCTSRPLCFVAICVQMTSPVLPYKYFLLCIKTKLSDFNKNPTKLSTRCHRNSTRVAYCDIFKFIISYGTGTNNINIYSESFCDLMCVKCLYQILWKCFCLWNSSKTFCLPSAALSCK